MSMNRYRSRAAARVGATALMAGLLVFGTASAAWAHVTAHSPDQPAKGGNAEIVFRAPNEAASANMVKLRVNFSTTSPIGAADVRPAPGWTDQLTMVHLTHPVVLANTTITDAVGSITWTAQPGNEIKPGEFAEFAISVEGLPTNTNTMVMPAVQTYSDGTTVDWNQPIVAGQPEPEHPAPHLALGASTTDTAAAQGAQPPRGTDNLARWLAGAGLLLAALALGFALGALVGNRRRAHVADERASV